eukprot:UN08298
MFMFGMDDNLEADLEKELNLAFRKDRKGGAAKLLQDAVGVNYDPESEEKLYHDMDMDDLEAQLDDTLAMADMQIDDIGAQAEAMAQMMDDQINLDFENMNTEEVVQHVEETWGEIEENKEEQEVLKKAQENVVGHLVETNEWLFSALQTTLQSGGPTVATASLSSKNLPGLK